MKIVVASLNPAIERLLVVEENRPGAVHRLRRSETLAGGKGVNVARVLTQLQTPSFRVDSTPPIDISAVLIGPEGGPTGDLQAELLASEGLSSRTTRVAGWTRINEIVVDESHPDAATVYNAEGPTLTPTEFADVRELAITALDDADTLVCTGSIPPGIPAGFYAEWITTARKSGIRTLLDAHGPALHAGAAATPTIIKVNRDEVLALAGPLGTTIDDLVRMWIDSGTEAVIVTDGSGPLRARTAAAEWEVPSPAVPTRSAVGSGDAFTAGLVWSLAARQDVDWPAHLAVAVACGASNAASTLARLSAEVPPQALLERISATIRRV